MLSLTNLPFSSIRFHAWTWENHDTHEYEKNHGRIRNREHDKRDKGEREERRKEWKEKVVDEIGLPYLAIIMPCTVYETGEMRKERKSVHTFSSSPHKTPLQHQTSHSSGLGREVTDSEARITGPSPSSSPSSRAPRQHASSSTPHAGASFLDQNHDARFERIALAKTARRLNFSVTYDDVIRASDREWDYCARERNTNIYRPSTVLRVEKEYRINII